MMLAGEGGEGMRNLPWPCGIRPVGEEGGAGRGGEGRSRLQASEWDPEGRAHGV